MYHEVVNYEPVLKRVVYEVQEQPNLSPEIKTKLGDLKNRWSEVRNKVVDQQQALEEVVPVAITCEEAWEEFEPHLIDIEDRIRRIKRIPVEQKGLAKQQNTLKVSAAVIFSPTICEFVKVYHI